MTTSRQLAAIMFTDIVGYTALMDEDEEKAFGLLNKNRGIQKPIIEQYHGKWLKEIGDGILASFSTISEAVLCAIQIQQSCKNEPDLKLRIGIHQGEVLFQGDDVFGSGVNIASRLEPLAPAGGILVSGTVYKNIYNRTEFKATFIEEKNLKGVREPVKIYQILVEGVDKMAPTYQLMKRKWKPTSNQLLLMAFLLILVSFSIWYLGTNQHKTDRVEDPPIDRSVAIIPFKDISPESDQQWFSDGIMDAILSDLSKISQLRVISRTTMEQYRESTMSIPRIADEINVGFILEGSAQRIEDKVRIIVQLINAQQDEHVWSETYFREIDEIFAVQSDIARQIAEELKTELSPLEATRVVQAPTESLVAYDLFLKGQQYLNSFDFRGDRQDLDLAIHLFRQAINEDPNFYQARVNLGWTYLKRVNALGEGVHLYDSAQLLAEELLVTHPKEPELLTLLGTIYWVKSIKRAQLKAHLIQAVRLSPNDPIALFHLLRYFVFQENRYDLALVLNERLTTIEPTNALYLQIQWVSEAIFQNYTKGEALLKKALDIQPDFNLGLTALGIHYMLYQDDSLRGLPYLERALSINPDNLNNNHQIAQYYSWIGDYEKSEQYFLVVKNKVEQDGYAVTRATPWFPHRYAYTLWNLGRKEEANRYFLSEIERDQAFLNDSTQTFGLGFTMYYDIAGVYAFLGNKQKAFTWLEKIIAQNSLSLATTPGFILKDPLFTKLHGETEFQSYLQTIESMIDRQRNHYQKIKDLPFSIFMERIEEPLP